MRCVLLGNITCLCAQIKLVDIRTRRASSVAELADSWGSWENWVSDVLFLCFIIYQTFFEHIYIFSVYPDFLFLPTMEAWRSAFVLLCACFVCHAEGLKSKWCVIKVGPVELSMQLNDAVNSNSIFAVNSNQNDLRSDKSIWQINSVVKILVEQIGGVQDWAVK